MVAPNTGSILEASGGFNRTGTAVSTQIIIEVDGNAIGAIQNLTINETRQIAMIDEVGTDGHIDSVPMKSTDIKGSCQRTRFDNLRALAAFSRPYIHVASQRIPFDIVIKDIFAGSDPSSTIITTIKNVWVGSVRYSYRADNFVIVEDMDWEAEAIYSTLGANNNAVPSAAGGRNLPLSDTNQYELQTDRGGRRGALDAGGLLLAIEGSNL